MANIKSIPVKEFKDLALSGNYTIIDIRMPVELLPANGGKLFENALNIDFSSENFQESLNLLDKKKKYLIYCRSGYRTKITLELMKKLGFEEVFELDGGVQAWALFYL